ncbi:MAG: hypothetical protein ACK4NX_01720, partial [Candidatus Paceibacteria bacterium]
SPNPPCVFYVFLCDRTYLHRIKFVVNNLSTDGGLVGWRFIEHTAITGYVDLSYDELRPSNFSRNPSLGMGRVFTYTQMARK